MMTIAVCAPQFLPIVGVETNLEFHLKAGDPKAAISTGARRANLTVELTKAI
jgi:hypothetical protein